MFFLLTYLKTYALQVVQGRLFGMGQRKANQRLYVLFPALLVALRTRGDAPPAPSRLWRSGSASRRPLRRADERLPQVFNVEAEPREEHNITEQYE